MSYNPDTKHGLADYTKYMQVPQSVVDNISEGDDSIPLKDQRHAMLVYVVSPSDGGGGGPITIDKVGLKASDEVGVTNLSLNVTDMENTYSRHIVEDTVNDITYIAHAKPGTALSTAGWRAQKIDADGNRQWANNGAFTSQADNLSGLTYTY